MNIKILGINHKTAPIAIREKFFLDATQQDLFLSELKSQPQICQAFVLSTCNRTEIYLHLLDGQTSDRAILDLLAHLKKIESARNYDKYFYVFEGREAVEHLLKVASGLDSLILGENQIAGQVKTAFDRARNMTMLGRDFNVLANTAIRVGKKARNETNISAGGSSVSWAAVVRAEQLLGTLENKKILVIGAGKMSELAIDQICRKIGKGKLYLMNRTGEKAEKLAKRVNGVAVSFYDTKEILREVDVCFCSAGAPHYIIDQDTIKSIIPKRKNKKLVLIDISMPRNIDPRVADIDSVSLLMIDNLDQFIDANMKRRQESIAKVEAIVKAKTDDFYKKIEKINNLQSSVDSSV